MKKVDLINALNETEDDLLEAAQNARLAYTASRRTKRITAGILSAAAVSVCFLYFIRPVKVPDTVPDPVADKTPVPAPEEQHEPVTVSRNINAGMGMSAVMYYDLTDEPDYNPWTEDMDMKRLPVYIRPSHPAGVPYGLPEETMRARITEVLDKLDMTALSWTVETAGETGPDDIDADAVLTIRTETDEAYISCDGYGTVTVFLKQGSHIELPDDCRLRFDADEETARRSLAKVTENFPQFFGGKEWGYDLGGDYTFSGEVSRQYQVYPVSDDDVQTILDYAYSRTAFLPDDAGDLVGFRFADELAAAEKADEYPVIGIEEAYTQLYAGNCRYNTGIMPRKDHAVGDVQLIYFNDRISKYQMPYYRFLIDITDDLDMMTAEGLKIYGIYLVPAVDPQYILWED